MEGLPHKALGTSAPSPTRGTATVILRDRSQSPSPHPCLALRSGDPGPSLIFAPIANRAGICYIINFTVGTSMPLHCLYGVGKHGRQVTVVTGKLGVVALDRAGCYME